MEFCYRVVVAQTLPFGLDDCQVASIKNDVAQDLKRMWKLLSLPFHKIRRSPSRALSAANLEMLQ